VVVLSHSVLCKFAALPRDDRALDVAQSIFHKLYMGKEGRSHRVGIRNVDN